MKIRVLILLLGLCSVSWLQLAHAQPEPPAETVTPPTKPESLPRLQDMLPRTVEQLLNEKPCDWVVLNTNDVIVVDPVLPRPDTLVKLQEEITAKEQARRNADAAQRAIINAEIEQLRKLTITLAEEKDSPEYTVPTNRIKQIVTHEEHIIRAIDLALTENRLAQALELLTRLQRNTPDWPGVNDVGQRVVAADARQRAALGRHEEALVLLEELHSRNPNFPLAVEQLGEVIRSLAREAIGREDFRRAQFFLGRLKSRLPNQPVVAELENELSRLATQKMELANAASESGRFAEAAELAAFATRVWPLANELRAPHRKHTERHQILHVGVLSLPGEGRASPIRTEADERVERLTRINLFEVQRVRDGNTFYRTRVFDEWEPFDLGRTMRLTLKQFRQPWDAQGVVTAHTIAAELVQRLDPNLPTFDERLASFISMVRILSPRELELTFRRVPPRIEPLLAEISLPLPVVVDDLSAPLVDNPGGFRLAEETASLRKYVRRLPEPVGLQKYHVAEVIEHRLASPDRALQALHAGEVSMLPDMPDWIVRRLSEDESFRQRYFIQQFSLPRTHLLQFNPRSVPLRNRELRAALADAIDRDRLLRTIILRDATAQHGRLVTAPYLTGSPGLNVEVPQRKYDLSAAFALALAARKQLKSDIPPLTMVVSASGPAEAAAREIAAAWRQIGLTVRVVMAGDEPPADWDVLYRATELSEPVTQMWPFLTFSEQARISDLAPYPDWLKQQLVQLDRTSDQVRAVAALRALHRQLADDVAFVPLWEVDRFVIFRKNCVGYPQRPLHAYDGIDQWTVEAWYQTELPR